MELREDQSIGDYGKLTAHGGGGGSNKNTTKLRGGVGGGGEKQVNLIVTRPKILRPEIFL